MRVIATMRGFDGLKLREPDEEFDMPDGAKASWFEPIDAPPAAKPVTAPKGAKPQGKAKTISETSPEVEDEIA